MISTSGQSPASPHRYQQFIAGEWADAEGGGTFEDFSPYDGSVFAQVPASTAADARRAVESAAAAFPSWKATTPGARQRLLLRAADIVERRKADLMRLMALETGAVAAFSGFQVQWGAVSTRSSCCATPTWTTRSRRQRSPRSSIKARSA